MRRMSFLWACALVVSSLAAPAAVGAHKINTSYTNLVVSADTLKMRVRYDDFDLIKIGLDQDGDDLLFYEEMEAGLDLAFDFVEENITLTINGQAVVLIRGKGDITPDNKGNMFANLYFGVRLESPFEELNVQVGWPERFGDDHKNLGQILLPGQPLVQAIFTAEAPMQTFAILKSKSLWEQAYEFIVLGVEHIFLGYDHVMFLLALIVVGGRLRNLVKIVSAFTVAHSITLCLAVLEIVSLPAQWVEAGIALSIAYVAVENFWLKRTDYRWLLTLHGFGFANVLRDLGLPTRGLVTSLFSFNIGVEIGQIAIVALVFPVIAWLNRQSYQRAVVLAVSVFIGLFGLGWFIERVFELEYMPI
ncbi:MAG TPA: HupE/UreJ family protein [Candidatus Handelsmanbacteria bacterium]|nr:HupE/UreJ family protein [Candidatus Handelsmanbacteria bacterium]